ncbi:hypothetical protein MLD38_014318 [Melastoma candidum]|uniref:Uncharacterized protein n=1 Tax=Melastoma candidum TaxID=119954 RepID=A0ACB9REA4_9MYRT|nr:hypothetical protein MLD38_014318 [Melastoma candidum]
MNAHRSPGWCAGVALIGPKGNSVFVFFMSIVKRLMRVLRRSEAFEETSFDDWVELPKAPALPKAFEETSFDDWVELAKAPALPTSLALYHELRQLNFTIFLLTGRSEYQRNATTTNMLRAGYTGWEKLFLRGNDDQGKPVTVYKLEKRSEVVSAGYTIQGSSGDQWSDLTGFATAVRSFKLPNPMYYIP